MRVVIAGGGTAGHVNPALALAAALEDEDVTFLGTTTGPEARLVLAAGKAFEAIAVRGFDRARPLTILPTAVVAARALAAARRLLRRLRPRVVVGMGGYVSLPAALAARTLGIPVVLHEQNIVLGLANRVCAPFARRVAVSFEETLARLGARGVFVGNPVAPEIARADRALQRAHAVARWGLDPTRRTLLTFGGSQGAHRINEAAVELESIWAARTDRQVVHITGNATAAPERRDDGLVLRRVRFVERMIEAYAAADLVLCRGGASTVAELTAVGLPAIIVPYPHHRDRQQARHGEVLARAGAAVVLADADATGERVARTADAILDDPNLLGRMGRAAAACGRPDAAERLAAVVREAAA
jgi:UDP-N-acetylglucosamine--N-acetylmuramyl-(pentapeptide) pyrophosphoryl-undecaprenol N-acetylglucosamine transferase